MDSVTEYLESIMPDGVKVKASYAENPHPEGDVKGNMFKLLSETIHEVYGKDTVIAPNLMLGATDSRNYGEVCDNIFRFTGRVRTARWGEAHQVDEKMPVDMLDRPVKFIKTFLTNYGRQ